MRAPSASRSFVRIAILLLLTATGTRAEDFPIKRFKDAFQVFVMNRDGSNVRQLTDALGEFVNPRWSPGATKILCSRWLGDMNLVIFSAPK
jgi:Tol biopolymer transport system component